MTSSQTDFLSGMFRLLLLLAQYAWFARGVALRRHRALRGSVLQYSLERIFEDDGTVRPVSFV